MSLLPLLTMVKNHLRNFFIPVALFFTSVIYLYLILANVYSLFDKEYFTTCINSLFFTGLVIVVLILVIEFISNFFDKTSSWYTFFLSLSVVGMLLTSQDFIYINWEYLAIFHYFFFVGAMMSCIFFFEHNYKLLVKRLVRNIIFILLAVFVFFYVVLFFFHYETIALVLTLLLFLFVFGDILIFAINTKKYDFPFTMTYLIVFLLFNCQIITMVSRFTNGSILSLGVDSIASLSIALIYILVYLDYTVNASKKAYEKEEFEKRLKELQTNVLSHQINPHYVFNSLNTIKMLYDQNHDLGVKALELFSSNLRNYVAAGDSDIVTLDVELENVSNYIELENLKHDKPYEIIYNIMRSDFFVPYFSLQPLVENIVKYSKINEKEDGHIIISAEENKNVYVLSIEDNGTGFDVNKIKKTSHGINNSRERFRLLFNASFSIESNVDKGTKIVITIPKEKNNENIGR